MTDPRERVETADISCRRDSDRVWEIGSRTFANDAAFANWPEVVELAQKILAANEVWKGRGCVCVKDWFGRKGRPPCQAYHASTRGSCCTCLHDEACHAKLEELTDGK